ncbi:MAG TPA: cache domain-containing protein, partial [Ktedonobacteraceae bacterium]|nr:cache domain-containing protein [Ktedonobacteraceae bacterium]
MLKILERKITLQLLVFYGLFVIPLLLGGAELYFFQYDALQQSAQQADLGLAQAISQEVEMQVQGVANESLALAHNQAAVHLDQAQLLSLFSFSKQTRPEISEYTICDPSGKILLNYPSIPANLGQSFSAGQDLPQVLLKNTPSVLPGHINQLNGTYVVSVAMPIDSEQKRTNGVVILNLSLQQLKLHLNSVRQQLTGNGEVRIWIIDSTGIPIASTVEVPGGHNLLQRIPGLHTALLGKPGNLIAKDEQRDWLYSYVPVGSTNWAVIVG